MRREREDPDDGGQESADDRRQRDPAPVQRHAVGPPLGRVAEAQLDHCQLRRGEGEQDAETVEAREEEDRMPECSSRCDKQRHRDQRCRDD